MRSNRSLLARGVLVAALGRLGVAIDGFLDRLQVGQAQLGVDDLDVARWDSRLPDTWTMSASSKQRTTCAIASVSRMCDRNLLPRPSPCDAPATRPAMSTNSTVVGTIFSGSTIFAQRVEPRIRHGHDADVRIDGAERIVLRRDLRARERVEQRGLADVGQPDDAALDSHLFTPSLQLAAACAARVQFVHGDLRARSAAFLRWRPHRRRWSRRWRAARPRRRASARSPRLRSCAPGCPTPMRRRQKPSPCARNDVAQAVVPAVAAAFLEAHRAAGQVDLIVRHQHLGRRRPCRNPARSTPVRRCDS